MLSCTVLFPVDVRSKIRHVFELIFSFEKRDHYQNEIILNFWKSGKSTFLCKKAITVSLGRYSFTMLWLSVNSLQSFNICCCFGFVGLFKYN